MSLSGTGVEGSVPTARAGSLPAVPSPSDSGRGSPRRPAVNALPSKAVEFRRAPALNHAGCRDSRRGL